MNNLFSRILSLFKLSYILDPSIVFSHREASLCEAAYLIDKRKSRVVGYPPIQFVNTNKDAKIMYRKVEEASPNSFTLEGGEELYELIYNNVFKHKLRLNGERLLLCETASWYDFIGTEKSLEIYNIFKDCLERVPPSDVKSEISGEIFPTFLILRNTQVLKLRKAKKVISYPSYKNGTMKHSYGRCLLFYPLNPGQDISEEDLGNFSFYI